MGTITLSVPDKLKERMSKTDWINWSSVARRAFSEVLEDLKELESKKKLDRFAGIVSKSAFTEEDADILSDKVKASMHKSLKGSGLV